MFYRFRLCGETFETNPEPSPGNNVRRHKCNNGYFGYADSLGYMELPKHDK